ncbi:hypothetical protein [Streptomyces chiangmaiensis]|uniref:Uncharacterized protein n=1 Tax=Streptomyces chiangmaiensis TaxID=766497 RepID=A0ABU7FG56_9ACTN|nr:hypothetical protein [Streptomyces chiangmaiensis]MED7822592.1 hypothetical protein [Streptomyces chiangmaiensis]
MTSPRYLGTDPATGHSVYVSAEPGGALDLLADESSLAAAAALHAVVSAVLEADEATAEELAVFAPALTDALGEVIGVAAKHIERIPLDQPVYGTAARALRDALRGGHEDTATG